MASRYWEWFKIQEGISDGDHDGDDRPYLLVRARERASWKRDPIAWFQRDHGYRLRNEIERVRQKRELELRNRLFQDELDKVREFFTRCLLPNLSQSELDRMRKLDWQPKTKSASNGRY